MFAPFFIEFQLYRVMRKRVSKDAFLPLWYLADFAVWAAVLLCLGMLLVLGESSSDVNVPLLVGILLGIALIAAALFSTISWFTWLAPSEKEGRGEAWLLMTPVQRAEHDRRNSKEFKYSGGATTEDLRKMSRKW